MNKETTKQKEEVEKAPFPVAIGKKVLSVFLFSIINTATIFCVIKNIEDIIGVLGAILLGGVWSALVFMICWPHPELD